MDKLELGQIRKKLEIRRQETVQLLKQLEQETRSLEVDSAQDAADQSVSSASKESLFEQCSQRRTVLRLIEAALQRIDNGSFGECAGCGGDIAARRLQALPWTQFCLRCQEAIEAEVGFRVHTRTFAFPPTTALKRAS
jgi:DnaK suppressor protein